MRRFWLWPVFAAAVGALALPTLSVLAAPGPRPAVATAVAARAAETITKPHQLAPPAPRVVGRHWPGRLGERAQTTILDPAPPVAGTRNTPL